jgi:hypothetical protein
MRRAPATGPGDAGPTTSRRSVLIAFAVALTVFAGTHLLPMPGTVHELMAVTGGQPILDLKPSFSAPELYARLGAFGEGGRALYSRMLVTSDLVFPLAIFAFLFLLGRYAAGQLSPSRPARGLLTALPFVYLLSDMAENATIVLILADFPERTAIAAWVAYLTTSKRIGQVGGLLLPLILFFAAEARNAFPAADG